MTYNQTEKCSLTHSNHCPVICIIHETKIYRFLISWFNRILCCMHGYCVLSLSINKKLLLLIPGDIYPAQAYYIDEKLKVLLLEYSQVSNNISRVSQNYKNEL